MEVGELVGAKIAVDMYSVLRTEIVDRELCQLFFATEYVYMFPRTNGDILLHSILVWLGF